MERYVLKALTAVAAAELGFKYELHDVAKPDRPEAEIFKMFKDRLLNSRYA
jgi:hypothetical protein